MSDITDLTPPNPSPLDLLTLLPHFSRPREVGAELFGVTFAIEKRSSLFVSVKIGIFGRRTAWMPSGPHSVDARKSYERLFVVLSKFRTALILSHLIVVCQSLSDAGRFLHRPSCALRRSRAPCLGAVARGPVLLLP